MPFGGARLATLLTLSWALFAVNVSIQFPLLIRFGYTRISVLGTTVPLALVMLAVIRLHLTIASIQTWLPLLWAAGAAAIAIVRGRGHVRQTAGGSGSALAGVTRRLECLLRVPRDLLVAVGQGPQLLLFSTSPMSRNGLSPVRS